MEKEARIFNDYMSADPSVFRKKISSLSENKIKSSLENTVIKNFQLAAEKVPAYKDFLKNNNVNPQQIRKLIDFEQVPLTDKKNYLSQYPLEDLVLGGNLGKATVITMSSGSTGEPFYWPRSIEQDMGIVQGVEALFLEVFNIDKKKTLHLVSLGMGVWMAGDIMSMSDRLIAQKGYNLTVMHPGVDLEMNLKIIRDIGFKFDQVIISCYPPLAKDIVDAALGYGIDTSKVKIKFFVGGEPFIEEWRDYIFQKIKGNCIYKDISSCLGSSEGGVAGIETPLCILVRQGCKNNPKLTEKIFNDERIPSIIQYNALAKYFESVNNQLILTSLNGLPLIRYNTKDAGGVLYLSEFLNRIELAGLKYKKDLEKKKCNIFWEFPILYLFGRSDLTATIYGVNIYPENIRKGLLSNKIINIVSGKFTLQTTYDKEGNQQLLIKVELKKDIEPDNNIALSIKHSIEKTLKKDNSEFKKLIQSLGKRVEPTVEIKKYQSKEFLIENKIKYVKT